jgi:peptide/nickel transport system permease protein
MSEPTKRTRSRRPLRQPLAVASLVWLATVIVCSAVPSLVTRLDPLEQDLLASLQGPSAAHPLGTDRLGQDLLSRLVHGGASTLWGVLVATVVAVGLGVVLGLFAGYVGGLADAVAMRVADLLFAIPGIIILLVVLAVFPHNVTAAMVTFGVLLASGLIRIVRAATISVREELFVAAARVSGLSTLQILRLHILPRLTSLVIIQATLIASITLVTQAGLGFLGFGPPPPQPSWGGLIEEARGIVIQHPWALVPPGVTIALTVMALSLLGDAVRDTSTQAWTSSKLVRRVPRSAHRAATEGSPADVVAPTALLSLRNLTVNIPIRLDTGQVVPTTVVDHVSFDVNHGEVVGLVGESGCGKSVTALSILGLVPGDGSVVGGRCWFAGQDLTAATPQQWNAVRGRGIGFIAQEPMVSLDPTLRTGAQLAEAVRRHTRVSRREAQARVIDLLASVRLPDPAQVAQRYPHQMSGGMAQRVAIAFALAGDPRLLIADEPTTALDVTVQAEIIELLRTLSRERGMAVLIVTHDWGVVAELCNRAIVMYAGQVVEASDVPSVFAQPRHPYTVGLLESDPHRVSTDGRLPTIPGVVPAPTHWPKGCRFADRCRHVIAECRQAPVELTASGSAHVARCLRSDELLAQAVVR